MVSKGYGYQILNSELHSSLFTIQDLTPIFQKQFSDSNTFAKEEEAIEQCFVFGKKIIDGQIENCTVVDL